jgi:hypothetical protein
MILVGKVSEAYVDLPTSTTGKYDKTKYLGPGLFWVRQVPVWFLKLGILQDAPSAGCMDVAWGILLDNFARRCTDLFSVAACLETCI